ncbi:MAG: hypothetical protein DCF12_05585 [Snowella sp.]|nr:MAG: hypothetical protein DCF12_05585 [Snowella sp.]
MKLKFPSMSMSSLAKELQFSGYTLQAFLQGRPLPRKDFVNLCQSIGIKDWRSVAERVRGINIGQSVAGSVIAAGNNNLVISENGEVVEVVDHDEVTPQIESQMISQDQAVERIDDAVRSNLIQLNQNMDKARKESGWFFTITLVSASLGFVVVLAGVGLLLAGQVAAGIVSSISSILLEIAAGLFFGKDKELRDTIERYHQSISDLQRILTMINIAETIKSEVERDSLKKEIIYKALDIDSRGG